MARGRVTSSVTRCGAEAPQLCSTIPPGLICRRESRMCGDSRRGQGKEGICTEDTEFAECTEKKRQERPRICDEVGRGVGQGYFASHAGDCGFESHLVQEKAGGPEGRRYAGQ
jgi:hypothetical protein